MSCLLQHDAAPALEYSRTAHQRRQWRTADGQGYGGSVVIQQPKARRVYGESLWLAVESLVAMTFACSEAIEALVVAPPSGRCFGRPALKPWWKWPRCLVIEASERNCKFCKIIFNYETSHCYYRYCSILVVPLLTRGVPCRSLTV